MKTYSNKWRKTYEDVRVLGQLLKDSYPRMDDNKNLMPPICEIGEDEQKKLIEEIKWLTMKSDDYLNSIGLYPKPRLWKYSADDCSTWASHRSFRFKELLQQ